MSDLIDRNELIDYFCQKDCDFNPKDCALFPCHEIEIIKNAPSIQPTHQTPSNTLGALDCVERQKAIDELIAFKEAHKADRFTGDFLHWTGIKAMIENLPSAQPDVSDTNVGESISRQAAIDLVESFYKIDKSVLKIMVFKLKQLPSVQPTQLTDEDKETIRIHLSAFKERLCNQRRWNEAKEYEELISRLLSTPSVQPRKGKWIKNNPHSEIYRYACSECHAHHRARYDFCPSCGSYNGGEQTG